MRAQPESEDLLEVPPYVLPCCGEGWEVGVGEQAFLKQLPHGPDSMLLGEPPRLTGPTRLHLESVLLQ